MNSSISAFGAQDHTFPFNSTFLKAALEQLNDKHYTSVAIWAKFSRGTPSQSRSIVHQELLAKLETARVLGVNGGFVPLNRIKEILTADRIQQLFVEYYSYYHVPSQLCEIPEQVSQHAPRLLATIILACIENPVPTLVGFLEKGYSDSSMPLNYSELPSFCRRMDYDLICATQPQALVADISLCTNDLSIHTFSCQYRLPFIERSLIGEGAFGQVFKVKINTQDLDLWPLSSESFAIKQIHGHMEQDFLREFETLRALSSLKHPHLVDLLGAFKYCKKYHLVFPLASGSLHNFLIQYDPRSDRSLIPWIWGQLAGIADGLHHLHTGPDEQTTVKDPLPEKERPTLQEPQRDKFGYHHDIKPDNILCFPLKREGEEGRTVWKIADFGMARYHGSFNDQPHRYGTLSYIPPELDIRSQYPSPSSPYDIWSLGGMLSEVVAWILGGPREIGRFRTERYIASVSSP
jgi:hypothetical protein